MGRSRPTLRSARRSMVPQRERSNRRHSRCRSGSFPGSIPRRKTLRSKHSQRLIPRLAVDRRAKPHCRVLPKKKLGRRRAGRINSPRSNPRSRRSRAAARADRTRRRIGIVASSPRSDPSRIHIRNLGPVLACDGSWPPDRLNRHRKQRHVFSSPTGKKPSTQTPPQTARRRLGNASEITSRLHLPMNLFQSCPRRRAPSAFSQKLDARQRGDDDQAPMPRCCHVSEQADSQLSGG